MDFRRIRAQRQAELDEVLLRSLHAEKARVANKLGMILNEIEGAQKVIAEYQQQIADLQPQIAELRALIERLDEQEREILSDHERWLSHLAG